MDVSSNDFEHIRSKTKFAREDAAYLRRRQDYASGIGYPDLYKFIDQFGLHIGEQTLATKLFAYEMVKQTVSVPGHILEFGVWHGSNLLFMAKVLRLLQPSTIKRVIGFDNFEGLPAAEPLDGSAAAAQHGHYHGNEQTLREAIAAFELEDWIQLVKGDATETIPAYEEAFPESIVSLAWLDFDLYRPTKTALQFLAKRLAIGGIVVFDEAMNMAWPGETVALREFLQDNLQWRFSMIANSIGRQPTLCIRRES
jgi:hypothetical protein